MRADSARKGGHSIRALATVLLLVIVASLPSFKASQGAQPELARLARLSSDGASDPQERLRDELGEFMVYFERTLTRLKGTAIRAANDDPEQL